MSKTLQVYKASALDELIF